MTGRHLLAATVLAVAAMPLAGCAYQPVPTYSYYAVPCAAPPAVGGPPAPNAASPGNTTAPPAAPADGAPNTPVAPGAAATPQPTAQSCIAAVPNYTSYADPYPYWDYGWPYYGGGIAVGGFVGEDFGQRFHHHGFHDHDFHRGFRSGGFHGGGFHGGGFHGGGGHGGRG